MKVTTGNEFQLSTAIFCSTKVGNPHSSDYQKAWYCQRHVVLKHGVDFKDNNKKAYFGMCCSDDVSMLIDVTYYGFTEDIVRQSMIDHKQKADVFTRFPFNQLSSEDKAEEIRMMRIKRAKGNHRDFIVRNTRSSSKEHLIKSEKLAASPVFEGFYQRQYLKKN